jgi:predicted acetyltransferase
MIHVDPYLVCTRLETRVRAKPVIVVQDGQAQIVGSIVLRLVLSKYFLPQGVPSQMARFR